MNENESGNRAKIIEILDKSEGGIVSGAVIAKELGISRQAVSKAIASLRDEGLDIASAPQKGYSFASPPEHTERLSPSLLDYMMRNEKKYAKSFFFEEIDSTQSVVKELASQHAPAGIVVMAEKQTAGRGRRGRKWIAPYGKNLYFSVLLRPKLKPGEVQLLNLAAGLAVKFAVDSMCGISAELKWPNDIMISGKKICGILSEAAGEPDRIYHAVTGIGVNVNMERGDLPDEIKSTATSIFIETGKKTYRTELASRILKHFAELASQTEESNGLKELLTLYRDNCSTIGREVRIIQDDSETIGLATGVTEEGALKAETPEGEMIFAAADVFHLRIN